MLAVPERGQQRLGIHQQPVDLLTAVAEHARDLAFASGCSDLLARRPTISEECMAPSGAA